MEKAYDWVGKGKGAGNYVLIQAMVDEGAYEHLTSAKPCLTQ